MPNMSIDSLKANLTNPQRAYMFDVIIPVPVGTGTSTLFQIRAESASIPSVSAGVLAIPYKQTAGIQVAGKKVYDHTWTVTFRESEDHATYDALYSWTQAIVHDVAGVGIGEPLYKTNCFVNMLAIDGSKTISFNLKGAWLQTIGQFQVDYKADSIVTYSATFQFDSMEIVD